MPFWFIILFFSVFLTLMTSFYLSRQNGRNGHRNGSSPKASQEISSFFKKETKQTTIFPFKRQPKQSLILLGETQEPNTRGVSLFRKKKQNESPHDHHEDPSQDQPDAALRERRRPLRHPRREEDEEDEEEESHPKEFSVAPNALPEPLFPVEMSRPYKAAQIEEGNLEEWNQDEEFEDIVIVKKDAETQTEVIQEDKGVGAHLDRKDEAVQSSPVRENRTTQTILSTEEKGMSEPLETQNREAQVSPDQEDKSLQESPDHHSMGVGTDEKEMRDQSLQILPSLQDKSLQKDISRLSIGIQNFNIFGEDKSVQAEEERISISLSSLPKINLSFFSDKEKIDLSKSLSRSLSCQHPQNLLDELETIKSELILSPKSKSIEFEDSELQELSPKSIVKKQKSFHIEDVPLEVSIYPSLNRSLVESEVIENSILERSKSLSIKKPKSQKEIEDLSFEILDKSPKSIKKKPLDDFSFEIIEKASRKSSFSILSDEDKNH